MYNNEEKKTGKKAFAIGMGLGALALIGLGVAAKKMTTEEDIFTDDVEERVDFVKDGEVVESVIV